MFKTGDLFDRGLVTSNPSSLTSLFRCHSSRFMIKIRPDAVCYAVFHARRDGRQDGVTATASSNAGIMLKNRGS